MQLKYSKRAGSDGEHPVPQSHGTHEDGTSASRRRKARQPLRPFLAGALLAAFICADLLPTQVHAEFILFPNVTGLQRYGLNPADDIDGEEMMPAIDLFYSADRGRLRFLAEVLSSTEETIDVERLQLGWLVNPDTSVWLGRYHSPLGYWNTQFHHGAYLQTAISRPSISEFDDHGGILPMHVTGLFVEGLHNLDAAGLAYAVGFGAGPMLGEDELEALDLLHSNSGSHRPSTTLRLTYRPDALAHTEAGLFINYSLIPSDRDNVHHVRQSIAGLFGNWESDALRLIGEFYAVRTTVENGAIAHGAFSNANLQAEYAVLSDWTLYGRVERTFGGADDAYLLEFPHFVLDRDMIGVRFELGARQAMKLEFSNAQLQDDHRYDQLSLQWSAALP